MKRRTFFQTAAGAGLALGTNAAPLLTHLDAFSDPGRLSHVEARHYVKLPDREIECRLCPRNCRLGDKERGYCGVRENVGGVYHTLVYAKVCALNNDPIEKKPFFHFLPGTSALSLATAGCNVNCKFCQNWEISQVRPEQVRNIDLPPRDAADLALRHRSPSIAYTYSEPVVFFEYMMDTAAVSRSRGLRNVVVTGGYINPEPLAELLRAVDAVKVDLKGFNEKFYAEYVRGRLGPVLEAIKLIARSRTWLEIVYLVIPGLNDDRDEIRRMSRWLVREAGPDVPLHFSRFHPMYLMKNLPSTPLSTLESARSVALSEGLRYVYIGNVPGHEAENTVCPSCGRVVIRRVGFQVKDNELQSGRCRFCRHPIPGVWT
ncbi:MAG: AmmeMemoRadiSam system radical SAM enzyme [Candidatus Aminicenantes bacterium]|nr:AmmeMemoRadiSam system radical SAM enzyme [Candidatus Aminicenantes bacterium]